MIGAGIEQCERLVSCWRGSWPWASPWPSSVQTCWVVTVGNDHDQAGGAGEAGEGSGFDARFYSGRCRSNSPQRCSTTGRSRRRRFHIRRRAGSRPRTCRRTDRASCTAAPRSDTKAPKCAAWPPTTPDETTSCSETEAHCCLFSSPGQPSDTSSASFLNPNVRARHAHGSDSGIPRHRRGWGCRLGGAIPARGKRASVDSPASSLRCLASRQGHPSPPLA